MIAMNVACNVLQLYPRHMFACHGILKESTNQNNSSFKNMSLPNQCYFLLIEIIRFNFVVDIPLFVILTVGLSPQVSPTVDNNWAKM